MVAISTILCYGKISIKKKKKKKGHCQQLLSAFPHGKSDIFYVCLKQIANTEASTTPPRQVFPVESLKLRPVHGL